MSLLARDGASRRGPQRPPSRRPTAFVCAFVLAAIGCERPRLPDVPPPPAPFERYPYVQAVTDSSATIIWWTHQPTIDTLLYWTTDREDTAHVVDATPSRRRRIRLSPFPARTRLHYQVRSSGQGGASATHTVKLAPPPGAPDTFSVLVWGDSGWGSDAQVQLARLMATETPALALHTGDIAYNDGSALALGQRHFRVYRRLLARVPLFPALGNHDVRAEDGRAMDDAFVWDSGTTARRVRYYSFDWGRAHFVALNSNEGGPIASDLREGGAQYDWLRCDLARAAARPSIDWIIVYLHHTIYDAIEGASAHGPDFELRRSLTPLFDRYGVDLVFSGHEHVYERSRPIRGGEVDSLTPGTVYIITGGGGAPLRSRRSSGSWHTAAAAVRYHFILLSVDETAIRGTVIGRRGQRIDTFELERRETGAGAANVVEGEGLDRVCPQL